MKSRLSCICLDDELPALMLLEAYCKKIPELQLIKTFSSATDALAYIKNNPVDLAIMDIQMPELNGIDFFKQINKDTLGIFISANPSFAIQAFDIDIVDFILKPATFERFEKSIRKAYDFLKIKQADTTDYITVKHECISKKIRVADIQYVEGSGEYLKIITKDKTYMQFQRLKDFETEYSKQGFVRIHKSYLVPKENIASAKYGVVKLNSGAELPIGRVYKDGLKF